MIKTKNKPSLIELKKTNITFFKCVYLRRSYFAMESIEINFDTFANFGTTTTLEIPKSGDLINKMYVKIELPELSNLECNDIEYNNDHMVINDFLKGNRKAYKKALILLQCDNQINLNDILMDIKSLFAKLISNDLANKFMNILKKTPFKYNELCIIDICSLNVDIDIFTKKIHAANDLSINIYNYFFGNKKGTKNKNYIKNIGNKLIKEVTFYIGNQKIDKQYSEWLNIWFELFGKNSLRKAYNKMINDNNTLYIPLQFWFNQNIANSLSLLNLENQKIKIEIVFEDLQNIFNKKNNSCKKISFKNATMLIDYIFLEPQSKQLFNKNTIIPIEQIELMKFEANENTICILDNFNKPCKELIWGIYPQNYKKNVIINSSIKYNDYDRVSKLDNTFYNYVIPYYFHTNSPTININVYPFSLFTEQAHLSGSSDLKLIPKITLNINCCLPKNNCKYYVYVFSRTINYLIINKYDKTTTLKIV